MGGLPHGHKLKILRNTGYIVGYDESMKNPAWAAYRIEWKQNFKRASRPSKFKLDSRTVSQIKHENYTGSGFDRGHMAPNYGIAMSAGIKAQIETFLLSNIVPQSPNNNRKIWKRLEMRVAKRLSRRFKEIWVITGPIYYNESPKRLPPAQIAIPDAFYKILIDEYEPTKIRSIAFIIPQDVTGNEPLKPYLTSINRIEELTGLTFFTRLAPSAQKQLKESTPAFVW
ncbi:MAG: hypothetical protein AUJ82_06740 [Verrucomicrobia bacterium CG1_02_43_26]|nr:MAG: hypothetical protein AUJ82_06740 [Verrucomicrobia bacterium CG1_02_43_26]